MDYDDLTGLLRFVLYRLGKAGALEGYTLDDPDLMQEGYLAAIKALKTHDGATTKASTFLVPSMRGAILDYVKKERNAGMASKRKALNVISLNDDSSDHCEVCDYVYGEEDVPTLIEAGHLNGESIVYDVPIVRGAWSPTNFDKTYAQEITAAEAQLLAELDPDGTFRQRAG